MSEAFFNVQDYGAVGDGTTDDGPSIQDAIDALELVNGGTLYFPPTSAGYLVQTACVFNNGATNRVVRVMGEGSKIICVTASSDTFVVGAHSVMVEGLTITGDLSTQVLRAFALGGNTNSFRNCAIIDVKASWAAVGLGGINTLASEINIVGSDCGLGVLWSYGLQNIVDGVTGQDGNINGGPCWVRLDCNFQDNYHQVRNVSCDESIGAWINASPTTVNGTHRISCVTVENLRGIKYDTIPCLYAEGVDRLEVHNATWEPAGQLVCVDLVDCGTSRFRNCRTLVIGPQSPISILRADSDCVLVEVDECDFGEVDSQATTTLKVANGVRTSLVPGGTTERAKGLLMKLDSGNPGQYVPATTGDAASAVMGVSVYGPAKARATFTMPAVSAFTSANWPGYFYIDGDDDVPPSGPGMFAFSDSGHGFGGLTAVDLGGISTATQVAAAFAAAIAGNTTTGFSVTASNNGADITIETTTVGSGMNRQMTGATFPNNGDPGAPLVGAAAGALVGGTGMMEIGLLPGQIYEVQIDGTTSIAIGDKLTVSTTTNGQAKKATSGAYLLTATEAAGAVAGTLVRAIFQPGTI